MGLHPLFIREVRLNATEMELAVSVGKGRRTSNVSSDNDRFPVKSDERAALNEILGAAGELAACIWLGAEWPASVDTFRREPDFRYHGIEVEVKTTRAHLASEHGWPVHPSDPERFPDQALVCVAGDTRRESEPVRTYFVCGWRWMRDVPAYAGEPYSIKGGGYYWIPHGKLQAIDVLERVVREGAEAHG